MFYDKYMALCHRRGISPSKAAEEAGFAKSLVSKWKSNKVDTPSAEIITKLSAYFGIPVSELLGEETQKEKSPSELQLTEGEEALLELFRKVPEDKQAMVIQMIRVALDTK
jgi:transcriptional regulator with XRE-family HTH domain